MKALAVYCGSKAGNNLAYAQAAADVGRLLAKRSIRLVYGGGKVGLMGIVAEAVMQNGGAVTGIITELINELEVGHTGITELVIVDTMHERKRRMSKLADGCIILPGAVGTMDELFEHVTWTQLKIHHKPCGILNINSFYDDLLRHLERMISAGFLDAKYRTLCLVGSDPEVLLDRMAAWKSPHDHAEQYPLA